MPGSFVIKSRHHTTFHFRRRVPLDLAPAIGKTHQVASLKTESRRQATVRARLLATHFDALFASIRMAKDPKKLEELIAKAKQKIEIDSIREHYENELIEQRIQLIRTQKVERAAYTAGREGALLEMRRKHAEEIDELKRQEAASTPEPAPAPKPTTPSISEVWESYKAEKIASKAWKDGENTAKYDHWPHVRTLIEVIGNKPVGEVTAIDINTFLTHVINSPNGGSPRNREKRLTRAGAVLRWAKGKRIIADAFADLFRYPTKIEENPFIAFNENELKALFESDDYRNSRFNTPSEYWLPLLALHTGARLNELCQLTTTDINEHEGVKTISILDDSENKRLKTAASRRIIPIHSNLINCGFLDYVATVKEGRLFPELPENPDRPGDFTAKASEYFTEYRRKQGVGEQESRSNKTYHSFRSTLISKLRKAEVPGDRRRRLAGHEAADVHDRNYSGGDPLTMFSFKTLQADIEKAQFAINFTPYKFPIRS